MPKITKINGYVIYFWSNENNEPCHVHVSRKKATPNATKIWLLPEIKIEHNKSKIPKSDLNDIFSWIKNNSQKILNAWNEHFHLSNGTK